MCSHSKCLNSRDCIYTLITRAFIYTALPFPVADPSSVQSCRHGSALLHKVPLGNTVWRQRVTQITAPEYKWLTLCCY